MEQDKSILDFGSEEMDPIRNEVDEQIISEIETGKSGSTIGDMLGKILTAETGEGEIKDYLDHPLNFNKTSGLAQILRGITGIFGNLKLAWIDVAIGMYRATKKEGGFNGQTLG